MSGQPTIQRVTVAMTYPRSLRRLIPMALLLCCMVGLDSSDPIWAAVYKCVDAAGKTVLTNRQSGFRNCRALTDMTQSQHASPGTGPTTTEADPSIDSEIPPPLSDNPPLPRHRPADRQNSSMSMPPSPNPDGSSSQPPPQPCHRGLNPLNPLVSPPCSQSEQSGADPSSAAPALPR